MKNQLSVFVSGYSEEEKQTSENVWYCITRYEGAKIVQRVTNFYLIEWIVHVVEVWHLSVYITSQSGAPEINEAGRCWWSSGNAAQRRTCGSSSHCIAKDIFYHWRSLCPNSSCTCPDRDGIVEQLDGLLTNHGVHFQTIKLEWICKWKVRQKILKFQWGISHPPSNKLARKLSSKFSFGMT